MFHWYKPHLDEEGAFMSEKKVSRKFITNSRILDEMGVQRRKLRKNTPQEIKAETIRDLLKKLGITHTPPLFRDATKVIDDRMAASRRAIEAERRGLRPEVLVKVAGRGPGVVDSINVRGLVVVRLNAGPTRSYNALNVDALSDEGAVTTSELDTKHPYQLVDRWNSARLVEELKRLTLDGEEGDKRLVSADYLLTNWAGWLAWRRDASDIALFQSHIGLILEDKRVPETYRNRWKAVDDVLETLRLVLISAARNPTWSPQ